MTTDEEYALRMKRWAEADLHPDLEEWVVPTALGISLKHPLVFDIPLMLPGRCNEAYAAKTEMVKRALVEQDWAGVIWLHERPYRLQAFIDLAPGLSHTDYWSLLGDVWIDSENIWQNIQDWHEVLSAERPYRHTIMSKPERRALRALPETLTVYRGAVRDVNTDGLSWTLDRERAEWFGRRFTRDGEPLLLVGELPRERVRAYFTRRSESEIVVGIPEAVRVIEEVAL